VQSRDKRGSSFVELGAGLIVLIPIVLVIFDLCAIVIGVQVNDSTCREAARVAASGNPLDAQSRAQAIIDRANLHASSFASNFSLASCVSTVTPQDVAALGTFGGPLTGTVTVQTDVSIHAFVVQLVYSGQSPLHFRSQQVFPFTYVVPNTTPTSFFAPAGRKSAT
jgi:Flp pilus assembly protein TadG